jgi:hypothetical protein
MERPLNFESRIAAITSSISAARGVAAACRRMAAEEVGSCCSGIRSRPYLPLFDHRRSKGVAFHVSQQGGDQGQKALSALLEQPEEELVAGDHLGLRELIPSSLGRVFLFKLALNQ